RLAAGGARFSFAHAHTVVTLPSHTSILTGHLPYEHGMRDNSGYRVKDGTETLATRLKAAGFATGAFVGGFPLTKRFGLTPGFDVYDDQVPEMKGDVSFSMPERRADAVVSRALDWIGGQSSKFFAWVHVFDPHAPYRPPDDFLSRYRSQPYDGEVAFVDHAFGPLFDRLRTLPRRTVVIVTADHGEGLGEHGELTHGMFAYEATLHVPLIVATVDPAAGGTRGVVLDTPVRHVDIAPTVLEAVAAPADPSASGQSLRDLIRTGGGDDRPTYFEAMTYNLVRGWAPLRGVIVGREKYIDLPIRELYDLAADPEETNNLAGSRAPRLEVLFNVLKGYNMAPPNRPGLETREISQALQALGYVSGRAEAKATYTEADDPKTLVEVDKDLHAATELYQNGKFEDALAMFNRVISRRPDTADAYIQLAAAYYQAGQPGPAIQALEKALAAGAPDRDIRIRLGLYLAETGADPARAVKLLETLPEEDAEALNSLGIAYDAAGRPADAIRTFDKLLVLDSTNGLALQNKASVVLRQALNSRNPGEQQRLIVDAERLCREALQADPSLAKAFTTLGVILANTSRKAEAIDSWKRAVELDNTELNALYNLTLLLAEANRIDEARAYARQYVATAPASMYPNEVAQLRKFIGG
ncbi:MAG TPA: sulfatase-like hydrolase/transferase, partial [Vicinamibacterales bacterium]|nr:sulfatase-like hydrolase/transferase [Vicinamibacterales bacterium]